MACLGRLEYDELQHSCPTDSVYNNVWGMGIVCVLTKDQ